MKKIRKKSDVAKPASAPSRPEGVWQTTAAVGLSLTKGNSDNLTVVGDFTSTMVSKPYEYQLSLGGAYGKVSNARTVQDFHSCWITRLSIPTPFRCASKWVQVTLGRSRVASRVINFTLVARERLEIAVNESAKVWQAASVQFDVSNSDNYVATAEVGLDFWLTASISARTVASDVDDNQPAAGLDSNDFCLTSGIAICF